MKRMLVFFLLLNSCVAPYRSTIGHYHSVSSNAEVQCLNIMPPMRDGNERSEWLDQCVRDAND